MLDVRRPESHYSVVPVYSVVLAGGRSTRMGQDKRFLQRDGEFLVDRAVRIATEISGKRRDHVFLCGSVPERRCIPDRLLGLGPLGGVLTATDAMERSGIFKSNPWVAVLPVDMPFLDAEGFMPLLSAIHDGLPSGCTAVSYQGFEMPFIFKCDSRAKLLLEGICRDPEPSQRSIHRYLEGVGVHRIECGLDLGKAMTNANFPDDWMKIRQEEEEGA